MSNIPELLNQAEVATELDKSVAWCERARWEGTGPAFIKIGRSVKYRRADVDEWIELQKRTSTRQLG